jgi:hypothetical protein
VKSCRSGDPAAIRVWALQWIEALATVQQEPNAPGNRSQITAHADRVDEFARKKLAGSDNVSSNCTLANAQFVIARAHGFLSWPAQKTFWGGYAGYFADPDGHLWEVAFNPAALPED